MKRMSPEEVKNFLFHAIQSNMSEAYLSDGFIWMFETIEQMIGEDALDTRNFLDDLKLDLYQNTSQHSFQSFLKYIETIDERIKTFPYKVHDRDSEVEAIKKEVYGETKDEITVLAEAVSTLLKSEKFPPSINVDIIEGFQSLSDIKHFTPENIAEVLRNDLADDVLDLSNHSTKEDECLDLAKHFVAIIDNPATPTAIKEQVERALVENASSMESYKDPGYIASILCRNQDDNKK